MIYLLPKGVVFKTQDLTSRVADRLKTFDLPDVTYGWEPHQFTERDAGGFFSNPKAVHIGEPYYGLTISDEFHFATIFPFQYHRFYQVHSTTGYLNATSQTLKLTYNPNDKLLYELRLDVFKTAIRESVSGGLSDLFDTLDERPVAL